MILLSAFNNNARLRVSKVGESMAPLVGGLLGKMVSDLPIKAEVNAPVASVLPTKAAANAPPTRVAANVPPIKVVRSAKAGPDASLRVVALLLGPAVDPVVLDHRWAMHHRRNNSALRRNRIRNDGIRTISVEMLKKRKSSKFNDEKNKQQPSLPPFPSQLT